MCKKMGCSAIVQVNRQGSIICQKCHSEYCRKCFYAVHLGNCQFFDPHFYEQVYNPEEQNSNLPPQITKFQKPSLTQVSQMAPM
jgi:hypothetical protein